MKTDHGSLQRFFAHTTAYAIAICLLITPIADSEARGMAQAPPTPQTTTTYTCEVPVEGAQSVRAAYDEYYECLEPKLDAWLQSHRDVRASLASQYDTWKASRHQDLRDRSEAARFVRDHPVDFSHRRVFLEEEQIADLAPNMSSEPAVVGGLFERFFVDRDAQRLFLNTDKEGLVSLDISQRYDFEVESSMGQSGGRDFFVVDENTALLEEDNPSMNARDLVVLDISDRTDPREIRRLSGALPRVERVRLQTRTIPDRPPSFDEYRAIQQGHFSLRACGQPPTVSTHRQQRCRPDGSCYRLEQRNSPLADGHCTRSTRRAPRPQIQGRGAGASPHPQPAPRSQQQERRQRSGMPDMDQVTSLDAESGAPTPSRRAHSSPPAQEAPQGGSGGAGSLSQMMVDDQTLFVLSAADGVTHGWLSSFDISDPRRPELIHLIELDNGPEALQKHDNLLLIAGRDALVTASTAVSHRPRLLGERRQRCPVNFDPVVVEGAIAYRTIIVDSRRSRCTSRLEVIDLSQPHQPNLRTTRAIDRPRGLAVLHDRLFVADERTGIQVFDITDPINPSKAATWALSGVKDLVLSDFDLYAMTGDQISTYYVGPLFGNGVRAADIADEIIGQPTVVRGDH